MILAGRDGVARVAALEDALAPGGVGPRRRGSRRASSCAAARGATKASRRGPDHFTAEDDEPVAPDSGAHTSPGRPRIWRTFAPWRSLGNTSNFSVVGIEAHHGVGAPLAQPHLVLLVDVDRVGLRPITRAASRSSRLPSAGRSG